MSEAPAPLRVAKQLLHHGARAIPATLPPSGPVEIRLEPPPERAGPRGSAQLSSWQQVVDLEQLDEGGELTVEDRNAKVHHQAQVVVRHDACAEKRV